MLLCFFVFFFSSRRRHTRLVSDWSSDVCSSDLGVCSECVETEMFLPNQVTDPNTDENPYARPDHSFAQALYVASFGKEPTGQKEEGGTRNDTEFRSEERRVGKEG